MSEDPHDTAQICLNGHVITGSARTMPQFTSEFCSRCGEATTTECAHCRRAIRGHYRLSLSVQDMETAPGFCLGCGRPYPWTEASLKAAQELAAELIGLTSDERDQLAKTLPDIIRDTPRTALASTRFKQLVAKAGPAGLEGFRKLLTDIASETAAKIILGGK